MHEVRRLGRNSYVSIRRHAAYRHGSSIASLHPSLRARPICTELWPEVIRGGDEKAAERIANEDTRTKL